MTLKNEAKLNAYNTVEDYCTERNAIVATSPAFQAAFNTFRAKKSALVTSFELEAQALKGIAMDKKQAKQLLATQFADVAALVYAFAFNAKNNTLKEAVNFSFTDLNRMKDDEINKVCANIRKAAWDNLVSLADYGVDEALIDSMDEILDLYQATTTGPRTAITNRRNYKTVIAEQIKEIDSLLKNSLDKIAVKFKKNHPDFYRTYTYNRVIVDPKSSTTQLKGVVTDAESKKAIAGVTVTAVINEKPFTAKTDLKGKYSIDTPVAGTYQLTFAHKAYKNIPELIIDIVLGKSRVENMELIPL
ncbi:MAG: carboxypeptidase-like regulatory domain-containing protein [Chitinophagaceae bacterium]